MGAGVTAGQGEAGKASVGSGAQSSARGSLVRAVVVSLLVSAALVYSWTGVQMNLLVAGPGFVNRIGNTIGTDFGAFYAAGVQAREGRAAALYDGASLRVTHERVMGRPVPDYPWAYPPPILLAMAPLSRLPFVAALWTWLALTIALLVLAAWRLCRHPLTPAAALLFPAVAQAAVTGPTGTLTGALFACGFACLQRRPVAAGLAFALLAYKPHLAVLVPLCLLAAGERRALAAFVAGATLLVAASAAAFGIDAWIRFAADAGAHFQYVARQSFPWTRMPTVFVAVLQATGHRGLAVALQLASFVVATLIALRVWSRSRSLLARSLALGCGALLATPYAFDYDLTVLLAPFACLLRKVVDTGLTTRALGVLIAMWVAPQVVWLGSTVLAEQVGPVLLAGLLAYAVREAACRRSGVPA